MQTAKKNILYYFEILLLILYSLFPVKAYTQKTIKIELINANTFEFDKKIGKDVRRMLGNVIFKHDNILLYCDSAYLYSKTNKVTAFSNVHIKINDTTDVYGDFLNYNGNNKIAKLHKNIKLIDNQTTLTTEHLIYNIKDNSSNYYNGGKIIDPENTLTSLTGHYYANTKEFFFKDSVVLINPQYTIDSDTLMYNTISEIAYFYGPTKIKSKENIIYCENGWYDTRNDISQYNKNAYLNNNKQMLKGDSLYYNRTMGIGKAFNNVSITDTAQNFIVKGNFAEYKEAENISVITDSALLILTEQPDSLFLHADTIKIVSDTTQSVKVAHAFHKAKFYKNDIQGIADSIIYAFNDSLIIMHSEPVLWSGNNQITADTIKLELSNNEINIMHLFNNSFIISQLDSLYFNQIKGEEMTGYFINNKLKKIFVQGNAETVYFLVQEDSTLIGINKSESSNMSVYINNDNKVEKITFRYKPEATLYPEKELLQKETFLRKFKWQQSKKPKNKLDIFKN
jgi:lipopolysaccharide export system protein LptA